MIEIMRKKKKDREKKREQREIVSSRARERGGQPDRHTYRDRQTDRERERNERERERDLETVQKMDRQIKRKKLTTAFSCVFLHHLYNSCFCSGLER